MIRAYYTAVNGAVSNQNYLDMVSNNMANLQTEGYKKSKAEFSDLLYMNIHGSQTVVGSGSKQENVDVIFNQGTLYATGNENDYAIEGDGFFAVLYNENTYFTRGGSFEAVNEDGENFLMYQGGYVLDENEEPIILDDESDEVNPGVFVLENNSALQRIGNNLFRLSNDNEEYNLSGSPKLLKGFLESSSVEVSEEMVNMLKTQRAFQLNSKVIQTADEIEQTINSLKN